MIKIHVNPLSTPALTVMLGASAIGAEYETHIVDMMAGAHKTPEYLKVNPAGKVPALSDGDFNLFESAAIIRYMARKAKSELYPVEYKSRALVDQWMDYIAHHVRSPFSRIQFNRMFAKLFGQEPDEESVQFGLKLLTGSLPILDAQIAMHGYVAGDEMSLADIMLLAALDPSEAVKLDLSPYPNMTAWRDKLRGQDFYTDVHSHFGVEMGM